MTYLAMKLPGRAMLSVQSLPARGLYRAEGLLVSSSDASRRFFLEGCISSFFWGESSFCRFTL
jgi:hypothetical protein